MYEIDQIVSQYRFQEELDIIDQVKELGFYSATLECSQTHENTFYAKSITIPIQGGKNLKLKQVVMMLDQIIHLRITN